MSTIPQTTPRLADLWEFVLHHSGIDPTDFARAIETQATEPSLDFRTRLLIRDGIDALEQVWGRGRVEQWLCGSPAKERLCAIRGEPLGRPGFPFLVQQLMEPTTPDTIRQFLRELGMLAGGPTRIAIGGSAALILRNQLVRHTQDIDVVDEIPAEIRSQHEALQRLSQRYRLQLTHFQSHYLPLGWEARLEFLGSFGPIEAFLVDAYDVAASKIMSNREKDRDDLRVLAGTLDKQLLLGRLRDSCASLLNEPDLRRSAEANWYILFGEALPA
jgi:hypothetical protein